MDMASWFLWACPCRVSRNVASEDLFDEEMGFPGNHRAVTGATAMAVARDGRIFVCEQTGTLRVVKNDKMLERPFVTVKVDSTWERGLIGVTLDPDFTARGDAAVPGSEVILFDADRPKHRPVCLRLSVLSVSSVVHSSESACQNQPPVMGRVWPVM
jgi:hypothetical protein